MNIRTVSKDYPLFLPESRTPRSIGVHVSSIIRCIATEAGILKPEWADELSLVDVRSITDPESILRISLGLAIEQYYIPEILSAYGVVDHPGELLYDGVYMSPDGEEVQTVIITQEVRLRVHEVKATYKSIRTVGDLSGQWMWLAQMKSYCIAAGTRFAVLHIFFLCGDYSYPIRPIREVWEIEFTQKELDDNWELLSEYKKEFDKRGGNNAT